RRRSESHCHHCALVIASHERTGIFQLSRLLMSYVWLIWVVIAAVLIAAEVMTTGFVLLWFGVGALAAALALVGVSSIAVQMTVFLIVSVLLVIASRTIFDRFLKPASPKGELKT